MDFAKDWSIADTALYGSAIAGFDADRQSTKALVKRGAQETDPLYGTPSPSGAAIDQGTLAGTLATGIGATLLPPKLRKDLMAGVAAAEFTVADQNKGVSKDTSKKSYSEVASRPLIAGLATAALTHLIQNFGADLSLTPTGDSAKPGAALTFTKNF